MNKLMLLAGNRTNFNYPVLSELEKNIEKGRWNEVVRIPIEEDFRETELTDQRNTIEEKLESSTYLVGYCTGGTLALDYLEHDCVDSVIAFDPPGLKMPDGTEIVPEVDENTFLIYSENTFNYRMEGEYPMLIIESSNNEGICNHYFNGFEEELAAAIGYALDYTRENIDMNAINERIEEENLQNNLKIAYNHLLEC